MRNAVKKRRGKCGRKKKKKALKKHVMMKEIKKKERKCPRRKGHIKLKLMGRECAFE